MTVLAYECGWSNWYHADMAGVPQTIERAPIPMAFDTKGQAHIRIDDYEQWPEFVEICPMTGHYSWPNEPPVEPDRDFNTY